MARVPLTGIKNLAKWQDRVLTWVPVSRDMTRVSSTGTKKDMHELLQDPDTGARVIGLDFLVFFSIWL